MENLATIYKPLLGASFAATYQGIFYPMPQTGNERDILDVGALTAMNPFAATLQHISSTVLTEYGTRVWKGITGPDDRKGYTNYWLWAEPGFSGSGLQVGSICNFIIESVNVFQCDTGTFSYGVSLKARCVGADGLN